MSPAERERIYELLLLTRAHRLRRVPTEENPRESEEEESALPSGLDPSDENLKFQLLANDLSEELDWPSARVESLLARALASRKPFAEVYRSLGLA